jgi:hypothetical protein
MNSSYTESEIKLFKKLNTPAKIQDFLNGLKFNFEKNGETCYSPRFVLKHKTAHCMEGAMLAAAILEFHGHKPLVMDLRSVKPDDDDHIVALFIRNGFWGAVSKTNHGVLRYREPIYRSTRELAMSYFHEYFLNSGKKTLREYSVPFNLSTFDSPPARLIRRSFSEGGGGARGGGRIIKQDWRTSPQNLFAIPRHLDKIKHYKILSPAQIKNLRKADGIEIKMGKLVEWKK